MSNSRLIKTKQDLANYFAELRDMPIPEYGYILERKTGKRTLTQNSAMHKYFSLLAIELNDAGLEMRTMLDEEVEIPWTMESVKEYLWKPVQKLLLKKDSTTKLTRAEVSEVFEVLYRHLATTRGIMVLFPSIDNFRNQGQ